MKAVAQASHKRSLADFQQALKEYRKELEEDVIVKAHLGTLYDTMLEQNLCRIIEPYSRVEVKMIKKKMKNKEIGNNNYIFTETHKLFSIGITYCQFDKTSNGAS